MPLTVTPGDAAADSYGTLADFKTYCTNMGLDYGTVGDADLEADLRRAAAFMDRSFRFLGRRSYEDQALAWPRLISDNDKDGFSIPSESIPTPIVHAQFEIAFIYASGNDIMAYSNGPEVKVTEVKAGPVSSKTEYVSGSQDQAPIPSIGRLLESYILSGTGLGSEGFQRITRA